jgi:hypothetical protein
LPCPSEPDREEVWGNGGTDNVLLTSAVIERSYVFFPHGLKRPVPSFTAEVTNVWIYTSTSPYVYNAWWLSNYRDILTFTINDFPLSITVFG